MPVFSREALSIRRWTRASEPAGTRDGDSRRLPDTVQRVRWRTVAQIRGSTASSSPTRSRSPWPST